MAIPAAQESTSEGEGREGSPRQGGRAGGEAESEAGSGLMEEEDGKKDCAREKRFLVFSRCGNLGCTKKVTKPRVTKKNLVSSFQTNARFSEAMSKADSKKGTILEVKHAVSRTPEEQSPRWATGAL